jgi:phage tail-like protein
MTGEQGKSDGVCNRGPSFQLSWGSLKGLSFREAAGLTAGRGASGGRRASGADPAPTGQAGSVVFKGGALPQGPAAQDWYAALSTNQLPQSDLVVQLLDEQQRPVQAWTLTNAKATRVGSSPVQSEGNEVALESLEVAFETMVISAP